MLRKLAIALAAGSLLGTATIPTEALAFGGGSFGGCFHGVGFSRGFGGHGFVGHGFRGRVFGPGIVLGIGLGLGLGYGAYLCYAWTPYGYRWVCGYPYPYY